MYKMCDQILNAAPLVEAVDYSLPNKHYFEIGMYLSPQCQTLSLTRILQI
jgi:urate oxidase